MRLVTIAPLISLRWKTHQPHRRRPVVLAVTTILPSWGSWGGFRIHFSSFSASRSGGFPASSPLGRGFGQFPLPLRRRSWPGAWPSLPVPRGTFGSGSVFWCATLGTPLMLRHCWPYVKHASLAFSAHPRSLSYSGATCRPRS